MWIKTAEGPRWGVHIRPRSNVPGGFVTMAPVIHIAFGIGGVHAPGVIVVTAPIIKVAFGRGGILEAYVILRMVHAVVGGLNLYVHGDSVMVAKI
jgi:hypothetical protein